MGSANFPGRTGITGTGASAYGYGHPPYPYRALYSIESELYLTSVRALVPELPLISSCLVQHQISDVFVVTLEMRYLMTQGTFGARISCAVDHMHPA